jgi:hypothetical protein
VAKVKVDLPRVASLLSGVLLGITENTLVLAVVP